MARRRDIAGRTRRARLAANLGVSWRPVFLALAVLALALNVLVPPGLMVAAPTSAGGFPLVLCTDHGAVTLEAAALPGASPSDKAPAEKAPKSPPCLFAGHGAAAPLLADLSVAAVEFVAYRDTPTAPARRDLAPGRGLAAPPLPARGPPILLT